MRYLRLLQNNPDFAKLWAAQIVSLLGDWFSTIVVAALVVEYSAGTGYQGLAVSGYLIARMLPPLLMRPLAGVLADRFDRKSLLIGSDLLRALTVLGLLLAAQSPDGLLGIYFFVILQFLLSSVFEPARNAIMPSILYRHELVLGNTLSSISWSAMLAIGAIVGGIIAGLFGTQIALLIDAMTFVLSAAFVAWVVIPPQPRSDIGRAAAITQSKEKRTFRDGLRYLRRQPSIAALLFVKAAQSLTSTDTLLIFFGTQVFVLGDQGITSMAILWAAFGVGAILGPLLTNRISDDSVRVLRRLIALGFAAIALGWLLWGLAASLEILVVAVIVRAMGGSINWTYSSVLLQQQVQDEYLGRMFSLDFAGFELAQTISILGVGFAIDLLGDGGMRQIVFASACIALLPILLWLRIIQILERREAALQLKAGAGAH